MVQLSVTLRGVPEGLAVAWHLRGRQFEAGDVICELPTSVAGAPTVDLAASNLVVTDDSGPLACEWSSDGEDPVVRRWAARRETVGDVRVAYLAAPVTEAARPATPPLELRAEGGGFSGALKCFLAMPSGPEDLTFEMRWVPPTWAERAWTLVTSLGESHGTEDVITGAGLERLGDIYVMCGNMADRQYGDGDLSTWWLTAPGIDLEAFTARLGATYKAMTAVFGADPSPYRVFMRTNPHRGANSSAHPASFVTAMNPATPLSPAKLYENLAHEVVHEWLHLDGPAADIAWFVEGSADYYSLVVPFREGLLDEDAFVSAVNREARNGYANVRRSLGLAEAIERFFSDFAAHWLPYTRGMFYLADLDARLRRTSGDAICVDDLVREVVRRRASGDRVGIAEWCALAEEHLGGDERSTLDAMVFTGTDRPGEDCFGTRFEKYDLEVPVLDFGFDTVSLVSRRVTNLIPGGIADRAGLREGDLIDLPGHSEIQSLNIDDRLQVEVTRDGTTHALAFPLNEHTAIVPQWRIRRRAERR